VKRAGKIWIIALGFFLLTSPAWGVRLKDITAFKGIRSNPLIGYGLVVGLNGTGDGSNTEFTIRSIANMLERMGVHIDSARILQIKLKNVAAVMVTANLPPFSSSGNRIDVTVSSIGDAASLRGGTLLMTPLKAVDQQIYAIAQGSIALGGYSFSGASGTGTQKNHTAVGMISKGAIVEREVSVSLEGKKELILCLFNPDFTTAEKVKDTINRLMAGENAKCLDSGTIRIRVPDGARDKVAELISAIEKLDVSPDAAAKVILNEKTGTIVMGENVRISTVAVAHGNLSMDVRESLNVSQPNPFAPESPKGTESVVSPPRAGAVVVPGGATVVTPQSDVSAKEEKKQLMIVPGGVNLGEVVKALNAIGVSPLDLITILQSIKAAGALQADLEIQ
jgi:flagellar P-ring protein precursor FlgI